MDKYPLMSGVDYYYMLNVSRLRACVFERRLLKVNRILWHTHSLQLFFCLHFFFYFVCHRKLYFIYKYTVHYGVPAASSRTIHIHIVSFMSMLSGKQCNIRRRRWRQWYRDSIETADPLNWMDTNSTHLVVFAQNIMDKRCFTVAPVCYWIVWSGPIANKTNSCVTSPRFLLEVLRTTDRHRHMCAICVAGAFSFCLFSGWRTRILFLMLIDILSIFISSSESSRCDFGTAGDD